MEESLSSEAGPQKSNITKPEVGSFCVETILPAGT